MNWTVVLKKQFRNLYYRFYDGSVTTIKKPATLNGARWLIKKENDRAYFKGYYEQEITDFLTRSIGSNDIFLDVGAHVGYFSLLASRLATGGKIISFEPFKNNIQFIHRIMDLNQVNNWKLVPNAVSDFNGNLFFEEGPTSSTGKVLKNTVLNNANMVEAISLDQLLVDEQICPNIVKIDVEGHGDKVLEGFKSFEKLSGPCLILLELHHNSNELEYFRERFRNNRITDLKGNHVNLDLDGVPHHIVVYNR
ncbi:MAG: FkbM family methyltransferase [Cytophagales bacterium]|nr:FkbM family methyltransferase [Cytophagales bacterium]